MSKTWGLDRPLDLTDYYMDPEILLEQIISYTIGASEMIPDIGKKSGKNYQLALLPHGPHFYTGILQSAWYLLLPEKKRTLFIMTQDYQKNEIFQITWTVWPILGRSRTFHEDKKIRKTTYQLSIQDLWILLQHIAFLSTITETQEIACLAVGENLSPAQQKKLTAYLTDCLPDTNIIFLQNFTAQQGAKNISEKTFIPANSKQSTIKSFHALSTKIRKKPQIIAYAHGNKKGKAGYACILA